ncbi:MAG: SCO family protein [Hyphomicrobium sp.]
MRGRVPSRVFAAQLAGCSALLVIGLASVASGAAGVSYPAPGSYTLDKIQKAGSGWVLEDNAWVPKRASSYLTGSITLFSFFYSTCNLPEGCPVAWSAFETVYADVQKDPKLQGRVRLVFLSLDPKVDTPELLSVFAENRRETRKIAPWHFLTTWSDAYLKPILEGMGQSISRGVDDAGQPVINHMIKVYLIDREGSVREIYTTAFLDPQVVLNDIMTLVMEEDQLKLGGH